MHIILHDGFAWFNSNDFETMNASQNKLNKELK